MSLKIYFMIISWDLINYVIFAEKNVSLPRYILWRKYGRPKSSKRKKKILKFLYCTAHCAESFVSRLFDFVNGKWKKWVGLRNCKYFLL